MFKCCSKWPNFIPESTVGLISVILAVGLAVLVSLPAVGASWTDDCLSCSDDTSHSYIKFQIQDDSMAHPGEIDSKEYKIPPGDNSVIIEFKGTEGGRYKYEYYINVSGWSIFHIYKKAGKDPDEQIYNPAQSGNFTTPLSISHITFCLVKIVCSVEADAGPDQAICTDSSVEIGGNPTASGGNPSYTYSWSPSAGLSSTSTANPTASPNTTTTYTVTVTDSHGCTDTDSMTVTVKENPDCTITLDTDAADGGVCANSTGHTASVPAACATSTYTWTLTGNGSITSGQGTRAIVWDAGSAGSVKVAVEVTDCNGCECSSYEDVTVNENPNCTITLDTDAADGGVCANSTGHTASVPAACATSTYTWTLTGNGSITSGQGTRAIVWDAGSAGSVKVAVEVTDCNGCECSSYEDVTVNENPDCTITLDTDAADGGVCANSTGHTASVPAACATSTYTWTLTGNGSITSGQGTRAIVWDAGSAGSVKVAVEVTDCNGCECSSYEDVTVNENPNCTITLDTDAEDGAVCANSTGHTASVPAACATSTYTWTLTGNGSITSGQGTRAIVWDAGSAGSVKVAVEVTDCNGCECSSYEDVTVNENPNCTITLDTDAADGGVCANSTGHTASVPAACATSTYTWTLTGNGSITSGQGTRAIVWDAGSAGSVKVAVEVTDCNGCECSSYEDVTVNENPNCTITLDTDAADGGVCANSTGHTASVPAACATSTYTWTLTGNGSITSGQGTRAIVWDAGSAGSVKVAVEVTDCNGCECSSYEDVTVNENPDCTITLDTDAEDGAVCANSTGHTASVPAACATSTYTWTLTGNGSITSGQGTRAIVWDAGSAGSVKVAVEVTDCNGCECSSYEDVTVNENPNCTITLDTDAADGGVCANSTGHTASVPAACATSTYTWTLTGNGSITSGQGTRAIVWDAGSAGSVKVAVEVTDCNGCECSSYEDVTVNENPNCTITLDTDAADGGVCANSTGHTASVPAACATSTYTWTLTGNGSITSGQGTRAIVWDAGSAGSVKVAVEVTDCNGCECSSYEDVTVNENPNCTITLDTDAADGGVCANSTGHTASVPAACATSTYTWTLTGNGSITSGQGTRAIVWDAGSAGSVKVAVEVTDCNGCECSSYEDVTVNENPDCTITLDTDAADGGVCANSTGHTASVPAACATSTYTWTLTGNGSITSGQGTRAIVWDAGSAGSVKVAVEVTDCNGCECSSYEDVTVNENPDCTITLDTDAEDGAVCANSTGHTASVPAACATSTYTWTLTGNGSITSGQGTRAIVWDAGSAGSVKVAVEVTDCNGCECSSYEDVTVNENPDCTITLDTDAADGGVCANSTGHTASVPAACATSTYTWTLTGNGSITSGQGTRAIVWDAGSAGSVKVAVEVTDCNGCECSSYEDVTVNENPNCTITLDTDAEDGAVCANSTGHTASVPAACATSTYTWTLTGNGSITSGQGTRAIVWDAGSAGSVKVAVEVTDCNGCECSSYEDVTVNENPNCTITLDTDAADGGVCANSTGHTASVPAACATSTYTWTLTGNGSITSGQGTRAIVWDAGSAGSVKVAVEVTDCNGCECSSYEDVTVNENPNCTITLDTDAADGGVCANSTGHTASVPAACATSTYTWTLTGNGSITSGQGTRAIVWDAGSAGSVKVAVEVTDCNGCECSSYEDVTVNENPDCTITLDTDAADGGVCANSTGHTASVPAACATSTYTWTLTGNGSITSGQGTRAIVWDAGSAGSVKVAVEVTDCNGCECSSYEDVTVNENPNCTITADAGVPEGSTGNTASVADAGLGATYAWWITGNGTITAGDTTTTVIWTAGNAGTATLNVTVTNVRGCSSTCQKGVPIWKLGIDIEKTTNGEDADTGTGPYIQVGDPVTWKYTIKNTSGVSLYNVVVTDDKFGPLPYSSYYISGDSGADQILGVDETWIFQASGTATIGQYSNEAEVTAEDSEGNPVFDTDSSHYKGVDVKIELTPGSATNKVGDLHVLTAKVYVKEGSTWELATSGSVEFTIAGAATFDDGSSPSKTVGISAGIATATIKSSTPGSNTIHAKATLTYGTDTVSAETDGVSPNSGDATKKYVDVKIELTPGSATNKVGDLHVLTAKVYVKEGSTWELATSGSVEFTIAGAATFDDGSSPSKTVGISAGIATATIKSSTPGSNTIHAKATLTYGTDTVSAETDGVSPNSGDATKKYVDVKIELTPGSATNKVGDLHVLTAKVYVKEGSTWELATSGSVEFTIAGAATFDDGSSPSKTVGISAGIATATIKSSTPGSNTIHAKATLTYGTDTVSAETDGVSPNSGDATKKYVDVKIELTPGSATNKVGDLHVLIAKVYVKEGSTWELATSGSVEFTIAGAATFDDGSSPSKTVGISAGIATATIKSSTPGSNTIHAKATLTYGTDTVSAETDGVSPNSGDATKKYVDVKIELTPGSATNKIGEVHEITATVEVDTGGGFVAAPNGTVVDFAITGDATFVGNGLKTITGTITNGAGTVSVTLNSSIKGSNTINATAKLAGHTNVTATTGSGAPNGPDASKEYVAIGIRIEKATNGQDADAGTGPYIAVGGTVTWSYTVTNLGDTPLSNVVVTDDNGTPGDPTDDAHPAFTGGDTNPANGLLDPAEAWTYQATGTAVAGQYENIATVTGTPPVGGNVFDNDYSHYFGAGPGVDIEKHTNGVDADAAPGPSIVVGDPITWSYVVTNTGNVTLTNITVTDTDLGAVGTITSLAPGASQTLTKTGTAAVGQYENTGTASVNYNNTPYQDTDDSHYFGAGPGIDIEKATNGQDADSAPGPTIVVGDPITWTYVVANTGNVTLTNIVVTDSVLGAVGTIASLAPGASQTLTKTGTAVAGQYENIGFVTGKDPLQNDISDSDYSHYFGTNPGIAIVKDGPATVSIGGTITYDITITNTGNVVLHNVLFNDAKLGIVNQDLGDIAVGGSVTIHPTYGPVTENDLPGPIVNTAIASSDEAGPVNDGHSVEIVTSPGIAIEKATNGEDADSAPGPVVIPGEPITWTYVVTNTGNGTLTNITVTDSDLGTVGIITSLAPGASQTLTKTGTAVVGQYTNTGTATVSYGGITYSDSDDSHYFGANPSIAIEKTPDTQQVISGTDAMFHIRVENTGDVLLTNVVISDLFAPNCASVTIGTLAVGAVYEYDCVTPNVTTSFVNEAVVTGEDPGGNPVTDTDTARVVIITSSISVVKEANVTTANVGDIVTYTYRVTNTGDGTLSNITLVDDKLGEIPLGTTTLEPGESITVTANYTVQTADLPGPVVNVVTATGTDSAGNTVTDEAQETVDITAGGGGATEDTCEGRVVINEVAWAGTAADSRDEWIELRNLGTIPVDLTGWTLRWRRKQPTTEEEYRWKVVNLSGILLPGSTSACELADKDPTPSVEFIKRDTDDTSWWILGKQEEKDGSYYTIERRHDETISNEKADLLYDTMEPYEMELTDLGDVIQLINDRGEVVDTANASNPERDGWPAGSAATFAAMERTNPLAPDTWENWHTNLGIITRGLDAQEQPLIATADALNSKELEELALAAQLAPTKTRAGARLEVGLDLPREDRKTLGWPWIRVTRPDLAEAAGGGGAVDYGAGVSFSGRYSGDLYWLGIDTGGLSPGQYNIWIVYGEGKAILVPILVLQ